jgi:type II secretory pathway pseudopilin PulG
MRTTAIARNSKRQRRQTAFFLVEATIGMVLLGLIFMALYTGLVTTTFSVQLSRENLRATQVMAEKLDTLRLYGWKKIIEDDPFYIQRGVIDPPVYSDDPSKAGNDATARLYNVEVFIEPAPLTETYAADMRLVTVKLTWQTGKMNRSRSMSTLISKFGLYKYVY